MNSESHATICLFNKMDVLVNATECNIFCDISLQIL